MRTADDAIVLGERALASGARRTPFAVGANFAVRVTRPAVINVSVVHRTLPCGENHVESKLSAAEAGSVHRKSLRPEESELAEAIANEAVGGVWRA
jgi:hypothetical protein